MQTHFKFLIFIYLFISNNDQMFLTIIKHENVTEPNWGEMKWLQVYPTNYPGYVSNLTLLNPPLPFILRFQKGGVDPPDAL